MSGEEGQTTTELSTQGIDYPLYQKEWVENKVFQLPLDFDMNVKKTVFVSNGMNTEQHLFLYPGNVSFKTGQALLCKPMKHWILDAGGDLDWVSLDPQYSIQAQLYQPYAHENQNNKTEYKAGSLCEALQWDKTLGTFNVDCSTNCPSIVATKNQGQKNDTFLFNVIDLKEGWKLRIVIFLAGTFLLEQMMTSRTKRYEIYRPTVYKVVLAEAASDNLSVTSNESSTPKWICISESITVQAGQVVAVALQDQGTQVILKTYSASKLSALNQPQTGSSSTDFSSN